jgi:hypothetical protein
VLAKKLAEINRDKGAIRIYSSPKKAAIIWLLLFFIIKPYAMYLKHKTQALFIYYLSLQLLSRFMPVNNRFICTK